MNKIKNLALTILATLMFSLAVLSPAAVAQDATEEIQRGLCAGANLDFRNTRADCSRDNEALETVNRVIRRIVNLLSVIVGIVAVIMIIIGGFRYVTSGGSDASVTGAKNTILYAVIGLIIVALAQLLVNFVLSNLMNT